MGLSLLELVVEGQYSQLREVLGSQGEELGQVDREGNTALHLAIEGGQYNMAVLLLNKGSPLEARNGQGLNPLQVTPPSTTPLTPPPPVTASPRSWPLPWPPCRCPGCQPRPRPPAPRPSPGEDCGACGGSPRRHSPRPPGHHLACHCEPPSLLFHSRLGGGKSPDLDNFDTLSVRSDDSGESTWTGK